MWRSIATHQSGAGILPVLSGARPAVSALRTMPATLVVAIIAAGSLCGAAFGQASAPPPGQLPDETSYDTIGEAFSNGKAGTMVRSSYFYRSKPNYNGPPSQAWGLGGWLYGETADYRNLVSLGGAMYYVVPLQNPELGTGNFILKDPGQDSYATIGEAWTRFRFADWAIATVGRQALNFSWTLDGVYRSYNRYDGAFIGRRDVRAMLPLDFETANVTGTTLNDTLRYYGGYASRMRQINNPTFQDLATGALLPGHSDGMGFGGVQWKVTPDFLIQGAYNRAQNLLNMAFVDADYAWRLGKDKYVRFDAQVITQSGTGANNLNTNSMHNVAGYIEGRWWPFWIPYAMIGRNSDGADLRSPYSLGPSYLVQRIGENAVAGEHTWIAGSTFDFKSFNLPGLVFDVSYGQRNNRHVANDSSKPLSNWNELATDLIYTFGKSFPLNWLPWAESDEAIAMPPGLRMRARWARVWQNGNNTVGTTVSNQSTQMTDIRFDLQYLIQFK